MSNLGLIVCSFVGGDDKFRDAETSSADDGIKKWLINEANF